MSKGRKVGGEGSCVSMDGFCHGVVVKLTQNPVNE